MKHQIVRVPAHQNAKVMAVLMTIMVIIFALPISLMFGLIAASQGDAYDGPPWWFLLIAPIFYLVFGYISTAIGCALYNLVAKFVGGLEIELR